MFFELVKNPLPLKGELNLRQDRVFLSLLLAVRQSGAKQRRLPLGSLLM